VTGFICQSHSEDDANAAATARDAKVAKSPRPATVAKSENASFTGKYDNNVFWNACLTPRFWSDKWIHPQISKKRAFFAPGRGPNSH